MRAIRLHAYGGPDALSLDEVPVPRPGPRDVLVEVHASSVNPVDLKCRAGLQRAVVRWTRPWIMGLDVSGVVVAKGARVTRFEVGDEVFASPTHRRPGCWADAVAIDERAIALKPARLSHVEAATLPLVGLTSYRCLVPRLSRHAGQRVLIEAGAGGVGTFAIQLARVFDAEVATTCSARNEALVRELGATTVIDYGTTRFDDVLEELDLVLESVGAASAPMALRATRRGGEVASIHAMLSAYADAHGPYVGAAMSAGYVAGYVLRGAARGVRVRSVVRAPDGDALARIAAWVDEGRIRPVVDRVFALEDIADAHRALEGGGVRGKIAIAVRPTS